MLRTRLLPLKKLSSQRRRFLLKEEDFKVTLELYLWVLFFRHHKAFVFSCFLIQVKHF